MAEQQQQQHKTKRNRKRETCVGQRLPETSSSAGGAGFLGARLRLVRCDGSHGGGLAEGRKEPHTWRIRTGSAWTSGPRVDTAGRNLMAGCQISASAF